MAIIDELRKAYEEDGRYRGVDLIIKETISDLSEKVRLGLILKEKTVEYTENHSTSDENSAKYMSEKLKERIEKEFRPQKLEVYYKRIAKGFFVAHTYYLVSISVSIKIN